jgi:hypothetical protein
MRQKGGYSARHRRLSFAGSLARLTYTVVRSRTHLAGQHQCVSKCGFQENSRSSRSTWTVRTHCHCNSKHLSRRDKGSAASRQGLWIWKGPYCSFLAASSRWPRCSGPKSMSATPRRPSGVAILPALRRRAVRVPVGSLYRGHKLRSAENYASGIAADPDDGRR